MFKDLFAQLLQKNNITAYKLSKDTGITEGLISQWKSGRQLPKYDSIKILCDYFNVSADYLLERTDNPEINKSTPPIKEIRLAAESISSDAVIKRKKKLS